MALAARTTTFPWESFVQNFTSPFAWKRAQAAMAFVATGSPVADSLAGYQVADGYHPANELVELATATAARIAPRLFREVKVWGVVGEGWSGTPSMPCSASARDWLTLTGRPRYLGHRHACG